MDDCNDEYDPGKKSVCPVQIPLWTIVTMLEGYFDLYGTGVQIPLWTIVTSRM